MTFVFRKASVDKPRLRIGLCGPAGHGKTFTALKIATMLAKLDSTDSPPLVGLIDSERKSASLYKNEFDFVKADMDEPFSPENYRLAIKEAARAKIQYLIIDSLTHAWAGPGGILEMVDNISARDGNRNNFVAWRQATPEHNNLVSTILDYPGHIICTMRSKMEYTMEAEEGKAKNKVKKLGMKPIQRDGMEYEFDIVGDMSEGYLQVTKTRCKALADKRIFHPGQEVADTLHEWLRSLEEVDPIVVKQVNELEVKFGHVMDKDGLDNLIAEINSIRKKMTPQQFEHMRPIVETAKHRVQLSTSQSS